MKLITQLSVFLTVVLFYNNAVAQTPIDFKHSSGTSWDFIVIGAGSAGSIVATRLSKLKWPGNIATKVLLIEAGGSGKNANADIPLASALQQGNPSFDWGYTNEVETDRCLGMTDQKCSYPRGKGLGGSSQINAMMYVRGIKADYDDWATNQGCTGWAYDDILPYFKKAERVGNVPGSSVFVSADHGSTSSSTGGPMMTEFPRHKTVFSPLFVSGAVGVGMTHVDYNSRNVNLGAGAVSYLQANTESGKRENAGIEYVSEIAMASLITTYNSHVTKLEITGTTVTAVLFTATKNGTLYRAPVTHEVIVSAGVINSPQILMLSGIGPAATLSTHSISQVLDLPVGQYMTDHISVFAPTYYMNTTGKDIDLSIVSLGLGFIGWSISGNTQLSIPYGIEGIAFDRVPSSTSPAGVPDYELMFTPASYATDDGLYHRKNHRLTDAFYNSVFGDLDAKTVDQMSTACMILHPKSIGSVTIRDSNPFSTPAIYPNILGHADDKYALLQCVRKAQQILTSSAFLSYNPTLYHLTIADVNDPTYGCEMHTADSDDYWYCVFKYLATSMYHMAGTCRMGATTGDATSVVGPDLKVIGMTNLRVADSSVIRDSISGHTAAITMVIGEKGADMIKATHSLV